MNKEKVVVLGNGYIGSAFKEAGYKTIGSDQYRTKVDGFGRLEHFVRNYDVVINCIGYTDTRSSEIPENFQTVMDTNAFFVGELSNYCNRSGKKLVHISTGDLYGNNHDVDENKESKVDLDVGTNYRLSKLVGERFCKPNDLILRIRLPFDGRAHPKNLLYKVLDYKKFFVFTNDFTYVPDLICATEKLLEANQSGIFNVTSWEDSSILNILQEVLHLPQFQNYDAHNENDPNIIFELSPVHVHNFSNIDKLLQFYQPTHLHMAFINSYNALLKHQSS